MKIMEYAERMPAALSGGQQQRVAIVRAPCHGAGCNALLTNPHRPWIRKWWERCFRLCGDLAEEKMTMVVVTHEIGLCQ